MSSLAASRFHRKSENKQFHIANFAKLSKALWEILSLLFLSAFSVSYLSMYSVASSRSVPFTATGSQSSDITTPSLGSRNEIDDGLDRFIPIHKGKGRSKGKGTGLKNQRPHLRAKFLGPAYKPSRDSECMACGELGHHVGNCVKALEDRAASSLVDCVRGYHFPYLHGVWRCQYCHMHLMDSEVKRQMPEYHRKEAAKEFEKIQKYGAPNFAWQ